LPSRDFLAKKLTPSSFEQAQARARKLHAEIQKWKLENDDLSDFAP
jgi:hypothetical protein